MSDAIFEVYRGVEIHELKSASPAGYKTGVQIEYVATIRGQTIKDRSVYRLKLHIDAKLSPHPGQQSPSELRDHPASHE